MSQRNLALVRRAYELFDTDLEGLLALVDPEIEWVSPHSAIEPGPRHGHRGVREAFAATAEAWEHPTHTPESSVEVGDKVLATITFRGHGRGSGMDAERTEFHVWTLKDGLIVEFDWFYDRDEAFGALDLPTAFDLSPPPAGSSGARPPAVARGRADI